MPEPTVTSRSARLIFTCLICSALKVTSRSDGLISLEERCGPKPHGRWDDEEQWLDLCCQFHRMDPEKPFGADLSDASLVASASMRYSIFAHKRASSWLTPSR